jgi:transcriptional regulator with XRE-family HTH domain
VPVGERIRELGKSKKLSRADTQRPTDMLPRYTSQVENGVTAPYLEMLQKYARGFEVPLYGLVYEGEGPPPRVNLAFAKSHMPR